MSQERELDHASNQAQVPPHVDIDLAPGRSSLSAKLEAPDKPVISGLIQRKAERDANGVAEGADSAIATASSSSGQSLPGDIQRKFESSLGTDLSSVRVHTGGESQSAAHAVGAKAYTMGQDIHFGAGHYDPSTSSGEHLLAHEVAHTVQQQGGSPSRQNKLEVSGPQDAAEHEADRAADAMVSGGQALVTGATGVARMSVQRRREFTPDGKFKIHPDDAYLQPGVNWDAATPASASPPEQPAAINISAMGGAPPIAGLEDLNPADYQTSNQLFPDPSIITKREAAWTAICASVSQLVSSYNATAPGVKSFSTAKDQLGPGGDLGPAPNGQNWDPNSGSAGSSLDKIADAQSVGPNTKVKDVFKAGADGKEQVQVSDSSINKGSAADKQAVSKLFEDARQADAHVGNAVTTYQNHLTNDMKVAVNGIASALLDVKVDDASTTVDQSKDDVAAAKSARDDSVKGLKSAADFFGSLLKQDPKELVKIGSIIGEQIINGAYDAQIKGLVDKVTNAKLNLQHLKDQRFSIAFDTAKAKFDSESSKTETLKQAIRDAILTRNRAYDAAADAAGKKAGGGAEGEKVAAAIKAIPKVKTVLAAVDQVTSAASPPAYSDASGVGFNAVKKQGPSRIDLAKFTQSLGELKGYKAKFDGLHGQWQDRLTSLETLVGKFNVPGS
jgi:Domain of unknown function (DUF4157)